MARVTACATLGYAAFDLETAATKIAARGFTNLEITELGSYCRHLPYAEADAVAARRMLDKLGLKVVAINVSTSHLVEDETRRLSLNDKADADQAVAIGRWFIDAATVLGAGVVSFPTSARVADAQWPALFAATAPVLRTLTAEAHDRAVGLNVEVPHLYQITETVEHVHALFEAVDNPHLGATVDSSHWGIIDYDLPEFLARLGQRLRHVHLRDSRGVDTDDFNQDLELTPGDGVVDFAAFGQALDDVGYRGHVSIEFEHHDQDLGLIEKRYERGLRHLAVCGWTVG